MILDQGITPALLLRTEYTWPDGLSMRTRLFARSKYIRPRHHRNVSFASFWHKAIEEYADISFGFLAGSNEVDNYRSSSIEKIKSDTLMPMLQLRYRISPNLYWDSDNRLTMSVRNLDYQPYQGSDAEFNDLKFNQLDVFTRQRLSYAHKKIRSYFTYEYQYLDRRYELDNSLELPEPEYEKLLNREKQKDYFRSQSYAEFVGEYQYNPRHLFRLSANNRYIQYDTPSETNYDDHDELSIGLSTEWKARWSRGFSTAYRLIGNSRQYAFLFKERSQDNYTQYSLQNGI